MIHHGHSIAGWPVLLAILLVTGSSCRPSGSQRVCAIDMGSNSFRRIVGTFADGAYTDPDTGGDTLLKKPFRLHELQDAVRDALERRPGAAPESETAPPPDEKAIGG